MSHHYLAPYVGTGTEDDPFRPKGVDGLKTWTAIDLRADCTQAAGFALLAVETPNPSIGPYLGDDPDAERPGLPGLIRASLGVLPEATRLRDILAELLIVHGRDDGTRHRPMRPSKDGQYTIWLGGPRHLDLQLLWCGVSERLHGNFDQLQLSRRADDHAAQ